MPTVYAIGETVYDIIFRHDQPVAARPGGAMLNSAVSLGRCGTRVEMITELGDDRVGKLVFDFLKANEVSTTYTRPIPGLKTPVSLAFLDKQGNAHYTFYKNYPEQRLHIIWPEAGSGDIVLFGSFYSLQPTVHEKIVSFLKKSREKGALVIYDPNIRNNHLEEIRGLMRSVEENISLADIVRGSDEDFENLLGLKDFDEIFKHIGKLGCRRLIITRGKYGAELISDKNKLHVPAGEINVISTIGAGDAFNAGIIFGIITRGIIVDDLVNIKQEIWTELIRFGINFAGDVCRRYDNYISVETGKMVHG